MKLNLAILRAQVPAYLWRAEREGFGWVYRGLRGRISVTVYSVSALRGSSDDDFETAGPMVEG